MKCHENPPGWSDSDARGQRQRNDEANYHL